MIVIDYYNFLYCRYSEISESIIYFNLNILTHFVKDKDIIIKIIFDGIYFKNINFNHKKIQLLFSSGMTADEYIINIFSRLQGRIHILVSKDQELTLYCKKKSNATIVNPDLFWKELDYLSKYTDTNNKKSNLIKTTDDKDTNIDLLFYNYFNKKK